MAFSWITDDTQLAEAMSVAKHFDAVAVDTEFRRRDTFYPQVALIQIAVKDQCWLIDPLPLCDPSPLAELLTNHNVIKVFHGASEDLEVFQYWLKVHPYPLFDAQKAAAMLNMGYGLSYRTLVHDILGIELMKNETQSNWLTRPLSEVQCTYAVQDVTYLLQCWTELSKKAQDLGVFDWILEEGSLLETGSRGPLAKFKSAWKLHPEQLAVLLALINWRDSEARQRDKPRGWILADKVISSIAFKMPETIAKLAGIKAIPRPIVCRDGEQLLMLIASARKMAKVQPPIPLLPLPPANAEVRSLVKALDEPLEKLARRLGMNVGILLPAQRIRTYCS